MCSQARTSPDWLASSFIAAAPAELRGRLSAIGDLGEVLAQGFARARGAWPEIDLGVERWIDHLAAIVPDDVTEQVLRRWRFEDLYLCCACVNNDPDAMQAFLGSHWELVRQRLGRLRLGSLAHDAEESLRGLLFFGDEQKKPLLSSYAGTGHLRAWLRVVVTRYGQRRLEADKREVRVGDDVLAMRLATVTGDELLAAKPAYRHAFAVAFRQAMSELDPADVTLLKLRFVDELKLQRIAALRRQHHTTVLRQLRAIQDRIALRTQQLVVVGLELSSDDFDSVVRLIQSDFGVTLNSFFADGSREPPAD